MAREGDGKGRRDVCGMYVLTTRTHVYIRIKSRKRKLYVYYVILYNIIGADRKRRSMRASFDRGPAALYST